MERMLDVLKGKKPGEAWVSVAIAGDELSVICIVPILGETERDLIATYNAVAHSVASAMHDAIEKIHDGSAIGNLLESALPVVLREALAAVAKDMEKESDEEDGPEEEPTEPIERDEGS